MQQYFIKGQVENPVIIKDKDTVKHMFNVMRLTEDDQVVLVFEDGIKRLARVTDRENHIFEVIEDLNECRDACICNHCLWLSQGR